jgi:hypothetical protein
MARLDKGHEGELVEVAVHAIDRLAGEIGSRPPTSEAEADAAQWLAGELAALGFQPEVESFPAYRSFGLFYLPLFGLALLARQLKRRSLRLLIGLLSVMVGWWEGEFRSWGWARNVLPNRSQNVSITIEPEGRAERTLCLVSHLDSSRSGLMFHPALSSRLGHLVGAVSASLGISALAPLFRGLPLGIGRRARLADRFAGGMLGLGFGLMLERELRGEDVPGANDNASGVGGCLALARWLSGRRLQSTRVVILVTGGEEAGLLGMRHFLESRDTEGWIFLNFDGIGAASPLRYLRVEGGPLAPRGADEAMMRLVEEIAQERPELGITACDHGSGMPYDSTAVMARGGRALTLTTQGRTIPNYHWPSDRPETIDREALGRAISCAQEMVLAIDRGAVDRRA